MVFFCLIYLRIKSTALGARAWNGVLHIPLITISIYGLILSFKTRGKTEGDNNRRKVKALLPKEYLNKARDLKTGDFLHQYGSRISSEKVPYFQSKVKPKPYVEPKKPSLIKRMIRAIRGD